MQLVRCPLTWRAHLTNHRTALRLKARGRATLKFHREWALCSLQSRATSKRLHSFTLAVVFWRLISSKIWVENSTLRRRLWCNSAVAYQLHADLYSHLNTQAKQNNHFSLINGVSQQLCTSFQENQIPPRRNFTRKCGLTARQVADTNNVNQVEWMIYRISVGSLKNNPCGK